VTNGDRSRFKPHRLEYIYNIYIYMLSRKALEAFGIFNFDYSIEHSALSSRKSVVALEFRQSSR
jgi:hypothetical protein